MIDKVPVNEKTNGCLKEKSSVERKMEHGTQTLPLGREAK